MQGQVAFLSVRAIASKRARVEDAVDLTSVYGRRERILRSRLRWFVVLFTLPMPLHAQGTPPDARSRALLEQMVVALGGDAWANRQSYVLEGNSAAFFKGSPEANTPFRMYHKGAPGTPGETRIELTKKRDVVQIWSGDKGYELTFKGKKELPQEIVEERLRAQRHSIDVALLWLKDPQTILTYGGLTMVGRWQTDSITLIDKENDSITLELDVNTHLPMRLSYKYRNPTYKDFDEDQEEYSDYHPYNGVQTPVTITRYHNGEMVSQRYYTRAEYNVQIDDALFDPDQPYDRKHK